MSTPQADWRDEQSLLNDEHCWQPLRPVVQSLLQRELAPTVAELQRRAWGMHPTPADTSNPPRPREPWDLPSVWP